MSDLTVANEIKRQLGRMFPVMTGATRFLGGDNFLQFRMPPSFAKDRINAVRITLNGSDLYDIVFHCVRGTTVKVVAEAADVHVEDLRATFTAHTGLATHL